MYEGSNCRRFRSPDGLKSTVFKAIQKVRTTAEDDTENMPSPIYATVEDEVKIADFRIFANNQMNLELKPISTLQEKNQNQSHHHHHQQQPLNDFPSTNQPLLGDALHTVRWVKACSIGDLRTVGMLVKEKPYLVSHAPAINHGFSGLHYAAKNGHTSVLRFLVMNGANINHQTSGYTPLHLAAIGKQQEIISILLRDYGANASIEDYSGHNYEHYLMEEPEINCNRIKNGNLIRNKKYELLQNETTSTVEMTQSSRLKSFRKAVHGRMRFFTDK